jgi:DNA-binding response OmpR family regulator
LNVKNDQRPLRILIVEDNTDIAENIGDYLEQQGHVLDFAMDGIGGLHLALTHDFDIIVLDIMLPGMDGLTFCRKLRKKPFALEELAARIGVLARRGGQTPAARLCVADLEADTGKMQVQRAGRKIELNRACFKILIMLMQAHPKVVTRKELEHALWGDQPPGSDALRSHIYALRSAIDRPFKHSLLETVHGVGYRLVKPDEISS